MIELRWLKRKVTDPRAASLLDGTVRVLQYRQMKLRIDASGALTPLPSPVEYTEWQDVPTVEESDAQANPG